MALTKKHFKAIAEIIRIETQSEAVGNYANKDLINLVCERIANQLSDYFISENSLFDRQRFLNACGIKEE